RWRRHPSARTAGEKSRADRASVGDYGAAGARGNGLDVPVTEGSATAKSPALSRSSASIGRMKKIRFSEHRFVVNHKPGAVRTMKVAPLPCLRTRVDSLGHVPWKKT